MPLFKDGACLYGFDFTADGSGGCNHESSNLQGSIDFEINFENAITETLTLVMYSTAKSTLIIDKFRNVLSNVK